MDSLSPSWPKVLVLLVSVVVCEGTQQYLAKSPEMWMGGVKICRFMFIAFMAHSISFALCVHIVFRFH